MKNFCKKIRSTENSAGVSLLELMLSLSIVAVIVIGATAIFQDWAERVQNRNEASYVLSVHNAAKAYVTTNFGRIMQQGFGEDMLNNTPDNTLLNNPGRSIVIMVGNPVGVPASPFFLKDGTVAMNANFPETTPSGRDIRTYVRNLGFIGNERALEVVTVTSLAATGIAKDMNEVRVRDVAQVIGPQAGVFIAANNCASGNFRGIFGNWRMANRFNGAGQMMSGYQDYCPVFDVAAGVTAYVSLYDRVNYKSADVGDYLYRVSIAGAPQANRMETNIDMNGNDISNISTMSVDSLQVSGNLVAGGRAGAGGNPATGVGATAVYVDENLRVTGNASRINARIEPSVTPGTFTISGGNMRIVDAPARTVGGISGNLRVQNLTANNGSLSAGGMNIQTSASISGSVGIQNNLNASTLDAGQAVSNRLTVLGGTAATPALSAPNIQAGSAGFGQMSAQQATAANINLASTTTTGSLGVVTDLGVGGTAALSGGVNTNLLNALGSLTYCRSTYINYKYHQNNPGPQPMAPYDCRGNGPN